MLKTPPLQTATATIDTLCSRLASATLLEDRRAAILGLRSFAKQYPASVASGSLRELIATLRRDGLGEKNGGKDGKAEQGGGGGDVDTIRLVLETLLMLFNPDETSPEAGEEIALFMADEFSMRQDNIAMLLNLLDPTSPYADYYSRLYSVQLLSAVCAARPDRLQECILSAPLGVSRLVGVLDDGRDAVRNAGLLLLVDLTSGANDDLRKIVAFEDVFGRIFALIRMEGGLAEAGITAQDCLSLLANLVKGSTSNQTMFRESGCVSQLAQLLQQTFPPEDLEAAFVAQSRQKSAFGMLQLLRLFLVPRESITTQNQQAFFRAGVAQILIDIGFYIELPAPIRTAALKCAADLISDNTPLQEAFAGMTVISPADAASATPPAKQQQNGTRTGPNSNRGSARTSAEKPRTYIIEALLDLTLEQSHEDSLLRHAACGLIQAYIGNHDRIKAVFLQRAISGHAHEEEAANILTILAQPGADSAGLVFASWIVQDLIAENLEAKATLAAVKEGDETAGEDALSFIQAMGSQLQAVLQQLDDPRTVESVSAYAGLMTVFLWDFARGVDDLLADGSGLLQSLVATSRSQVAEPLVAGLSATLLVTIYEFSTKDSPVPRRTLSPLLTQKLGRGRYLESLLELRRQPAVRDFDLIDGEDADPLLSKAFVDLFTNEYSRLRKAIDKDPGVEVLPPSTAEAGVDRDVLDDLRQQLQTAKDALAQAQEEMLAGSQKQEQDRLTSAKDLQTATAEIERLRRINQAVQQGHESELEGLATQHEQQRQNMAAEHQRILATREQETQRQVQNAAREKEAGFAERSREYERRIAELGNAHRNEQNGHTRARQELETLNLRHGEISAREKETSRQLDDIGQRYSRMEKEHQALQIRSSQAQGELEGLRDEAERHSSELDNLRSRLKDLQDELKGKDDELSAERTGFAELEKELEAAKAQSSGSTVDAAGVEELRDELKDAREAEKSAKEELDSMFLVMSDLEAKRDGYRQKVKELGGEVTEDEDDEDEDEGEEDEEEEDEVEEGDVD